MQLRGVLPKQRQENSLEQHGRGHILAILRLRAYLFRQRQGIAALHSG